MLQYPQASNTQAKVFKVLSIDGGGIKGLYSARILEQFEQKFDCRIADYFDLICGTSTGGLIALALSLKIPARQIVSFYYKEGPNIFKSKGKLYSIWQLVNQLFLQSKHNNSKLEEALQKIFDEHTLGNSHCLLCIPAFSLTDGRPFIFKFDHPEGNLSRDNRTRYVHIALATSAAPTILPIVSIPGYEGRQFVDGGVYANNPTLVGVAEALKYFVGKDKEFQRLMVMSVASLEIPAGRRIRTNRNRSAISWVWNRDLIEVFLEGQAYFINYIVTTLAQHCEPSFEHLRISSPTLSIDQLGLINLDNTSKEALDIMLAKGSDQGLLYEKRSDVAKFFEQPKRYIIR
jgi:predicted patatin/cPLA2 family phospholipase